MLGYLLEKTYVEPSTFLIFFNFFERFDLWLGAILGALVQRLILTRIVLTRRLDVISIYNSY